MHALCNEVLASLRSTTYFKIYQLRCCSSESMGKQNSFQVNHLFQCLNLYDLRHCMCVYIYVYEEEEYKVYIYIGSLLLSKANRNDSISYFGIKQR